ncbi:MAG: hypothetical protein HY252_04775 [Sphingobacteriales bacterium]|nr:hypothetical protein [Sphingobacteriales bacterium]
MNKNYCISLAALLLFQLSQLQTKIIDMHVYSYTESDFGDREPTADHYGNKGSKKCSCSPCHLLCGI